MQELPKNGDGLTKPGRFACLHLFADGGGGDGDNDDDDN